MQTPNGTLFVISGPSGVGKGSIISKVFSLDSRLVFSVSATTRTPRPGELEGFHYFFIDDEKFKQMLDEGKFLEWAKVHDCYYGTPENFLDEQLKAGRDVVLDIDTQGALQVMDKRPDSVFIFIAPPDMNHEILKERLLGRGTETDGVIEGRVKTAVEEMKTAEHYNYVVFNDDLETAVGDLQAIIRAERLKSERIFAKEEKNAEECKY